MYVKRKRVIKNILHNCLEDIGNITYQIIMEYGSSMTRLEIDAKESSITFHTVELYDEKDISKR